MNSVANVVAVFYSASLSVQLLGKHFLAVPRFVWNTVLAGVCLALAWGGRDKLESIFANFLPLLGYWTLAFGTILAIEHFWFRPRIGGYNAEIWQDQAKMPWGLAATSTLLVSIGFSFLGMSQTWVRWHFQDNSRSCSGGS
jgi:purine-cytosine permease-like protein